MHSRVSKRGQDAFLVIFTTVPSRDLGRALLIRFSHRVVDVGFDGFQFVLFSLSGAEEVATSLQVDPKPFGGSEKLGQPQGCARGDPPFSIHDFIDPLVGYMHRQCKIPLGDRHRHKELLQQYFARMGWLSIFGYSNHFFLQPNFNYSVYFPVFGVFRVHFL